MNRSSFPTSPPPAQIQHVDLKEYLDIIRRRKAIFVEVFVVALAICLVVTLMTRPIYQTQAKFLVPSGTKSVNIVDTSNPIATILQTAQPDPVPTQIQVLQSGPFLAEAFQAAGIQPKKGVAPPSVRVEAVNDTNIIQVTVEGGDPNDIARLANTILDLHLRRTSDLMEEGLKETKEFVRREREKAAQALAKAERELTVFRRTHRVVQLTAEQEARAREFATLENRVHELEGLVNATRAQIAEIREQLAQEKFDRVEPQRKENPERVELLQKQAKLKADRAELLLQGFLPTSDPVKAIDEKLAQLATLIEQEPETIQVFVHHPNPRYQALQEKLATLEADLPGQVAQYRAALAQYNAQKRRVDDLGPWEIQLNRLTQDRDRAQAAYNSLSERLQDLEIRSNARVRSTRIIEYAAVPTVPVRPRKTTNIILSVVVALLLAGGMALLQEYLDDRITSPEDLERMAELPALGHVPLIAPDLPRLVASLPANSHIAEAYRAFRSSVMFASMDAPVRRLQITSASSGEGKTITSVNLATAMAMDGKRVILVDADLRRPSIHRQLQIPNSPGLSEVLAGMRPIDEVVRTTDIENLRVVTSGPIPPNPAELLGSPSFDRLVEHLEEQADVVIFDTPPCVPVTDPVIVAARMDGVILVLHVGHTRKAAVKHAMELLARARARILGFLYNRVDPTRGGYYYYHYYYYYYGDGYYSDGGQRGHRHRRNGRALRSRNAPADKLVPARSTGEEGEGDES